MEIRFVLDRDSADPLTQPCPAFAYLRSAMYPFFVPYSKVSILTGSFFFFLWFFLLRGSYISQPYTANTVEKSKIGMVK